MPTCPVFTRAKIKPRFGIKVNLSRHKRDNELCVVYAGRTADVYVNPATVPGWIKKGVVSRMNERNEM